MRQKKLWQFCVKCIFIGVLRKTSKNKIKYDKSISYNKNTPRYSRDPKNKKAISINH